MGYKFEVEDIGPQQVLSIRTRTSLEEMPLKLGKSLETIIAYLKSLGKKPSGAPFVAYYNMDMSDLDIEIGFPVSENLEGSGDIASNVIAGGKKAFCMYKGSYSNLKSVYEEMSTWMSENNHKPTGVAYEFYYNSPMEVPESELLTKIVFPLE